MKSPPEDNLPPFEDPALGNAIRRAWGGERAPATLRQRLMQLAASEAVGNVQEIRSGERADPLVLPTPAALGTARAPAFPRRRPNRSLRWAAAALLLLAVGGIVSRYWGTADSPPPVAIAPRESFGVALASTHDNCLGAGDAHHAEELPPGGDMSRVAAALRSQLNRPVLAASPAGPGWHFHGARVCTINGHQAAHLVFVNGHAAVSVFSFSSAACSECARADRFEVPTTPGHAVTGFAQGEGLFCVVGSSSDGSLTLDRLRAFRDEFRPQVTAAADVASAVAHVQ